MKKLSRGFTLIEIAVVVAIIAILAAITLVAYNRVQIEARDTKRKNDISILQTALEKYYDTNGTYPSGCYTVSESAFSGTNQGECSSYTGSTNNPISPDIIGYDTTLQKLQTILPNIPSQFGDPRSTNPSLPFGVGNPAMYGASPYRYFYGGSHYTAAAIGSGGWRFGACGANLWNGSWTGDTVASNYLLAYYNESQGNFVFVQGKHGAPWVFKTGTTAPSWCQFSTTP